MVAGATSLSSMREVDLPQSIVEETVDFLRVCGADCSEGLVLWLGSLSRSKAVVVEAVVPLQQSLTSEDGVGYFVETDTLFALNRYLSEHRYRLIAQVHSHPGEAYHSRTDDEYAIVTTDGGLSLVVPNFGLGPAELSRWAVYRLQGGSWIEMATPAVIDFFHLT